VDPLIGATYLITIWGEGGKIVNGYHDVSILRSANCRLLFLYFCLYAAQKPSLRKYLSFFYLSLLNSVHQKILDEHMPLPPCKPPDVTPRGPRFPIWQFTSLTCVLHVPFIILVLDKENTNHHKVFCTPLLPNGLIPRSSHDLSCDPHCHLSKSFLN
jgi:hypothetical protein